MPSLFLHLDYLYTPSQDVAADARVFTQGGLGAEEARPGVLEHFIGRRDF